MHFLFVPNLFAHGWSANQLGHWLNLVCHACLVHVFKPRAFPKCAVALGRMRLRHGPFPVLGSCLQALAGPRQPSGGTLGSSHLQRVCLSLAETWVCQDHSPPQGRRTPRPPSLHALPWSICASLLYAFLRTFLSSHHLPTAMGSGERVKPSPSTLQSWHE